MFDLNPMLTDVVDNHRLVAEGCIDWRVQLKPRRTLGQWAASRVARSTHETGKCEIGAGWAFEGRQRRLAKASRYAIG